MDWNASFKPREPRSRFAGALALVAAFAIGRAPNAFAGDEAPQREIELTLTLDEVNLLLEALGNLPYARVYPLVLKIQQQAQEQLAAPPTDTEQPEENCDD